MEKSVFDERRCLYLLGLLAMMLMQRRLKGRMCDLMHYRTAVSGCRPDQQTRRHQRLPSLPLPPYLTHTHVTSMWSSDIVCILGRTSVRLQ